MTRNIINIFIIAIAATFSSCIREEALNAECDILSAVWQNDTDSLLNGDIKIINNEIVFVVKKEANFTSMPEPEIAFKLTSGARIEKDSTSRKTGGIFQYYTTHSEDGMWNKQYIAKFIKLPPLDKEHIFSFEHFELNSSKKYNIWYEINNQGIKTDIWASGNAGFSMSGMGKTPEDFPTAPDSAGVKGCCVKLTTRDTGTFGKMMKMPIAAGNIFLGEFLMANATKKPLEATRFGLPIAPSRPLSLRGYYKYTPGEVFTDKAKNEVPERRDTCAIYSVLYEIDPANVVTLDGSNVLSSENIVMVAQLENPGEPAEWTEFEVPFENVNGKEFDKNKLDNGEYAITVVASSSKEGAFFEGAVGSTLYIDEMQIIWGIK